MAVKMERTYWNKQSGDASEVKREDQVKAYKYGKNDVPCDPEQLKYESGDRSCKLLGFCPKATVPRMYSISFHNIISCE